METIFFDFLIRKSRFSVLRKLIFQRMLHSQVVETDFLGSTNHFFLYVFPETPARERFLLSSGNLFLNESFILAVGEGFFSLMETVTLLESFFYQRKPSLLFSGQWKPFCSIGSYIFQQVLHPNQRKRIFQSKRIVLIFIQSFLSCQ